MMTDNAKTNTPNMRAFLDNTALLWQAWEIVPLLYGSLGLEYLTGESLDADDIDMLVPGVFLADKWAAFRSVLESRGYTLIDAHEHTFEKDGIHYAYAPLEELASFAGIAEEDIRTVSEGALSFRLLTLEQYLDVYTASAKDGYRANVRQKKDGEKIALIRKHLDRRGRREETAALWDEGCAPHMDACAGQNAPSITLHRCVGERSPGVVLICPGGAYRIKADHEGAPIAQMLGEAGIDAAVLDYRVFPCPPTAPLEDAQRAIRLLRCIGYEKVAILGFSAGGNLACCAAMHGDAGDPQADDPVERFSSRPDALVSCYSVVSLTQHTHVGTLMNLLGERHEEVALQRFFSAERWVTKDAPPAFIWHTAQDDAVPAENSLNLAASYSRAGVPFELHIFPDGRHGLGLAQGYAAQAWSGLCKAWLRNLGFARDLVTRRTDCT